MAVNKFFVAEVKYRKHSLIKKFVLPRACVLYGSGKNDFAPELSLTTKSVIAIAIYHIEHFVREEFKSALDRHLPLAKKTGQRTPKKERSGAVLGTSGRGQSRQNAPPINRFIPISTPPQQPPTPPKLESLAITFLLPPHPKPVVFHQSAR